jgi:hypothetical protein
MSPRYHLVSGKTLENITDQLNDEDAYYGRIVYMEKTKTGYAAMIDTYALVIAHVSDLNSDEEEEQGRREYNQMMLKNLDLDTSNTL